ncbi:MAG: hypothetical protein IPM38_01155 [Ignavibacteria bacterium]|nr:hypothetical protein [Ignavibacteria bacterium]
MKSPDPVKTYLKDLDSFFYGGNRWQPGILQLTEDLNFKQAVWVPGKNKNSIWKIVMHSNFWKQYIFSIDAGKPFSNEEKHSGDWRDVPSKPDESKWQDEIDLMIITHKKMKALVLKLGMELFNQRKSFSVFVRENISHDAYHAGQIGLLRSLQGISKINF